MIFWFDHWWAGDCVCCYGSLLSRHDDAPLVTALVDQYGWRFGYTVFGASTFLSLFPVVYLFLVDRPGDIGELRDGRQYVSRSQDEQVVIEEDHRLWTWQELLQSPAFWSIGLILVDGVCLYCCDVAPFRPPLDLGLKTSEAAIILSITATFGALGKPLIGWLSDRFGARFTIWLGLVSQIIALLFLPSGDFWSAALAAGIYGFGYSGMSPLRTFAISTSIGSKSYAVGAGPCAGSNCLLYWLRPLWRASFMMSPVRTRWLLNIVRAFVGCLHRAFFIKSVVRLSGSSGK